MDAVAACFQALECGSKLRHGFCGLRSEFDRKRDSVLSKGMSAFNNMRLCVSTVSQRLQILLMTARPSAKRRCAKAKRDAVALSDSSYHR